MELTIKQEMLTINKLVEDGYIFEPSENFYIIGKNPQYYWINHFEDAEELRTFLVNKAIEYGYLKLGGGDA